MYYLYYSVTPSTWSLCIRFSNQELNTNKMAAAAPDMIINNTKNSYKFVIWKPKKLVAPPVPSSPPGIKALNVPANLLAAALAKNQVPIIKEDKRKGASLETMDKPIGDKHNSPIV